MVQVVAERMTVVVVVVMFLDVHGVGLLDDDGHLHWVRHGLLNCVGYLVRHMDWVGLLYGYLVGHMDWVRHGFLHGYVDLLLDVHGVRGRYVVGHWPVDRDLHVHWVRHGYVLLDGVWRWHGYLDLTVDRDAGDVTLVVAAAAAAA